MTKEYITKEVIRGHLRNWLIQKTYKKKRKYLFLFHMNRIMIEEGELTFAGSNKPQVKTNAVELEHYENYYRIVEFYIDNIMRIYLFQHNMQYVKATKKNLAEVKKLLKQSFKDHL